MGNIKIDCGCPILPNDVRCACDIVVADISICSMEVLVPDNPLAVLHISVESMVYWYCAGLSTGCELLCQRCHFRIDIALKHRA